MAVRSNGRIGAPDVPRRACCTGRWSIARIHPVPVDRRAHTYQCWHSARVRHEPPHGAISHAARRTLRSTVRRNDRRAVPRVRRTLTARCVADRYPELTQHAPPHWMSHRWAGGGKRARPLGAAQSSAATIWRDMRRSRPSHAAAPPPAHKSPPNRGSPRLHWPHERPTDYPRGGSQNAAMRGSATGLGPSQRRSSRRITPHERSPGRSTRMSSTCTADGDCKGVGGGGRLVSPCPRECWQSKSLLRTRARNDTLCGSAPHSI